MTSPCRGGLSHWAITHERWIWLLFSLAVVAGAASYFHLPVKRFPTVELPAVAVSVSGAEAAPAVLEKEVALPIEQALRQLNGVHRIWTQISGGQSITIVQFESRLAGEPLTRRVRTVVAPLKLQAPHRNVAVRRLQVESTPLLSYAVTSIAAPTPLLSAYVDEVVLPRLRTVPGVAEVRRFGGSRQHLQVELLPRALRQRGVTPLAVKQALELVKSGARTPNAEALSRLPVQAASGGQVPLRDIAAIGETDLFSDHAIVDGEPAVGFTISKSPDADSLKVATAVAERTAALANERTDAAFIKLWSTADETASALGSTQRALIEGMLLAALVVFLFLRNMRAALVVAVAMPISLVPTFAVLAAAGFSLNIVTLLALTLAVGILVDDAIVEVENIQRLVREGVAPAQAAPRGADSIALAVVATTLAIVAVFAPVSFMPGVAGRFFFEFGLTVSTAVIMSLLVARLLTPILAARLLKPEASARSSQGSRFYQELLQRVLAGPKRAIVAVLMVVGGSVAIIPLLPTEFQPTPEPDYYFVAVVAQPGSGVEELQDLARRAAAVVRARRDTRHVLVHLGGTPEGGGAAGISLGGSPLHPRSARIAVATHPKRVASLADIRRSLRTQFQRLRGGTVIAEPPGGTADLQVLLSSRDPAVLARSRARLLGEISALPAIVDPRPLLQGLARPPAEGEMAARSRLGAGEYEAAFTLSRVGRQLGQARTADGNLLPVHVRITGPMGPSGLPDVLVRGHRGELVSLRNAPRQANELDSAILRLDGERVDGIEADLQPGFSTGEAMAAIQRLRAVQELPLGVSLVPTGDQEELQILFRSMVAALVVAGVAVYATLALLFRSWVLPLIIVSALPLALAGAIAGLLISGSALNLPALIGFLLLLGLAAKNSILLVEHAARRVREGWLVRDSIVDASQRRWRAIIMTSVAMAAGMLPAALSVGAGDEFRQPMAFAVIGGLISSTALSLLFVPAVFAVAMPRRWAPGSKSSGLDKRNYE